MNHPNNCPSCGSSKSIHQAAWCDLLFDCGTGFVGNKLVESAGCFQLQRDIIGKRLELVTKLASQMLEDVKKRVRSWGGDSDDDEALKLAAEIGFGKVRRVKFDLSKHADDPENSAYEEGQEIWYWGDEK